MINMKSCRMLATVIFVISMIMLVGCSSNFKESELIGKWNADNGEEVAGLPIKSIEFLEDGKVIIMDTYSGTYKIINGKVQVKMNDAEVYLWTVIIVGDKLTLKQNDKSKSFTKD